CAGRCGSGRAAGDDGNAFKLTHEIASAFGMGPILSGRRSLPKRKARQEPGFPIANVVTRQNQTVCARIAHSVAKSVHLLSDLTALKAWRAWSFWPFFR